MSPALAGGFFTTGPPGKPQCFYDYYTAIHEIKRFLLLGEKDMTNLDSILKRRDITSPTKVHLVKAMIFPVVMYGCESWTVKKAECKELMLLNCGVGEDS